MHHLAARPHAMLALAALHAVEAWYDAHTRAR